MRSENGFTLVELLVAAAIIGILCGLAVESFAVYRSRAYESLEVQVMSQTRTALEAGKMDSEQFPAELMTVSAGAPGALPGATAEILLPGLRLPNDFQLLVQHNPTCESGLCLIDFIEARHCKIAKAVRFWNIRNDNAVQPLLMENVAVGGACPAS